MCLPASRHGVQFIQDAAGVLPYSAPMPDDLRPGPVPEIPHHSAPDGETAAGSRSGEGGASDEQRNAADSSTEPFALDSSDITFEALDLDPYPVFAALQARESVSWIPRLGMWFVTHRRDVLAVLRDTTTYSTVSDHSLIGDTFGSQMLSSESALHRRYKSHCNGPFNATAVRRQLEVAIGPHIESLLARFPRSGSCDLKRMFATPLSVVTICSTLGVPAELSGRIIAWYQEFRAALSNFRRDPVVRERGHAAAADFRRTLRPLLATFDLDDSDKSLLGHLARPHADRLSDEEILSNALIVLFGGIETTESAILNCAWSLLAHPAQLAQVRDEPALLLPNAVDEGMRWESAVQSCTRFATTDAVIGSARVRAGDTVQCMLGAANRDPAHFDEPHRYDARRANAADHLSFGSGVHFCLGTAMARGEITLALTHLLKDFPELTLADPIASAPRGFEFRAPASLVVELRGASIHSRHRGEHLA